MRGGRAGRGPGSLLGGCADLTHVGLNLGIDRVEFRFGRLAGCEQSCPQPLDRAAFPPRRDVFPRSIRIVAHALRMRARAVGLALEQSRPSTRASAFNGPLRGLADGQHVVAIKRNTGEPIGRGAGGNLRVAGGVGERNFGRKLVIFTNK